MEERSRSGRSVANTARSRLVEHTGTALHGSRPAADHSRARGAGRSTARETTEPRRNAERYSSRVAGGANSTSSDSWERPWIHSDEVASTARSTARVDRSQSSGSGRRDRRQVRHRIRSIGAELRRTVRAVAGRRPRRRDLLRWLPRRRHRTRHTPTSDLADRSVFNAVGFDPDHDGVVIDLADLARSLAPTSAGGPSRAPSTRCALRARPPRCAVDDRTRTGRRRPRRSSAGPEC